MDDKRRPGEGISAVLMNDSFPPLIDGVGNAVVNYASVITAAGGRAAVATPRYPGVTDDYPFPVVRYPSFDSTKLVGYRTGSLYPIPELDTLAQMRPTVIHSHCPMVSTVLARTLRGMTEAPLIVTYHTKFDIDIEKVVKPKFLREQAIRILVDNMTAADEVWVVSEGAGENLRSLGFKGDYRVMENGVDVPRGRLPEAEAHALDGEYKLPIGVPVFLFVGRMMWYKGVRLILEGLSALKAKGIPFRALLVGGGTDLPEMQAESLRLGLTEELVTFTGPIRDRSKLRVLYNRADLFLFPSTFDTNGIVVREAAAQGLGSVLIRGSCASEGVPEGRCCLLTEETGQSMAEALFWAVDHLPELRVMGENAMNEIYLSWEDSIHRAMERYRVVQENMARGMYPRRREKSDDLFRMAADFAAFVREVREAVKM